jgi:hypothetical protein
VASMTATIVTAGKDNIPSKLSFPCRVIVSAFLFIEILR